MCITRLHNFCINMREDDNFLYYYNVNIRELWCDTEINLEVTPGFSELRNMVCEEIQNNCLVRPPHNVIRNNDDN